MTHPERSWLQPHTKLSEEPLPDEAEASPVVDLRIVGDDQETEVCLSILAALEAQSKEIKTNELNNSGVAVFRPPSYLEFDGPLYVLGAAVESLRTYLESDEPEGPRPVELEAFVDHHFGEHVELHIPGFRRQLLDQLGIDQPE